jgi:hypothetical protein
MRQAAVVVWMGLLLAQGCGGPDLGECDMAAIAWNETAMPHEGQLLINQTCASGRCHSTHAEGKDRVGVPAGLNFDVVPLSETQDELALVERNAERVRDMAEEMWAWIDDGTMPPQGQRAAPTAAQKETIRNWLSCGAPIVPKPAAIDTSHPWRSIFSRLQGRQTCLSCHGSTPSVGGGFQLSATGDACEAHTKVVSVATVADGMCGGREYVVPGMPDASVLLQKLEGGPNLCGALMPQGATTPFAEDVAGGGAQLATDLRMWIAAGALKPPDCP